MRRIIQSLMARRGAASPAAVLCATLRYQSTSMNNNNNNSGSSFAANNNNNSATTQTVAAKNQGAIFPGQPRFDVYDIQDDPSLGYRLRVTYNDRKVYLNHFSQLGPRKADPMDPAPQFDESNRHSIRLFIHEIAGFLTVCDGLASQYKMSAKGHELTFEPLLTNGGVPSGYRLVGHTMMKATSANFNWDVKFEGQHAVMLRHFLNSSLNAAFGFGKASRNNNNNNNQNNTRGNNNNNNSSNFGGQQQQQQRARNNNRGYGNNNNNNNSNNRGGGQFQQQQQQQQQFQQQQQPSYSNNGQSSNFW